MDNELVYAVAIIALIAIAIASAIIAVRRDGRGMGDLVKQLILFAAIGALTPLSSYAGATLLHPRTKLNEYNEQRSRVQQELNNTKLDDAARKKDFDEVDRLSKLIDEETRLYYRAMFWIAFPVGLIFLVVGFFVRVVSVGTGLAFGGLCTLISGCYSYWDAMGDGLRFSTLLFTLVILIVIGMTKFGRTTPASVTPV